MARLLRVPEISAGSTEAVLATWPVAENVPYSATEVIAVVETAKAAIDIEAEEDGVILRRLVGEGADVTVGQPIALIGVPGESSDGIEETLLAQGVAPASPPVVSAPLPATDVVSGNGQEPPASQHREGERIFVSPLARRLTPSWISAESPARGLPGGSCAAISSRRSGHRRPEPIRSWP
jgi:pyruvate dehydrogenase E2 component (dihydrolipoamide acetyltransferase)